MFKPTSTDWTSRGQARRSDSDARHATSVTNHNAQVAREAQAEANSLRKDRDRLQGAINHNAKMFRAGTEGITLTGYTNTPSVELAIYRNDLVAKAKGVAPQLTDGMPFTLTSPNTLGLREKLTVAQREDINLRLLARMEWIDWCQHVDVIARFGQLSLEAFLNPTAANAAIRSRDLQQAFAKEAKQYNDLREQAMNIANCEEGSRHQSMGERIRQQFEEERYRFWKGKVRFKDFNIEGGIRRFPCTDSTLKANPGTRFDLHLPAGRLLQQFGINIATGKPGKVYHERFAINQFAGTANWLVNGCFL